MCSMYHHPILSCPITITDYSIARGFEGVGAVGAMKRINKPRFLTDIAIVQLDSHHGLLLIPDTVVSRLKSIAQV